MMIAGADGGTPWGRSLLAAAVLATSPESVGGVVVRARSGPVRDAWLARLQRLLPRSAPMRRVPPGIGDDRLVGGLDLAATLASGRPTTERGLLEEANGGIVVVPGAERLEPGKAARVAGALDLGAVAIERDGLAERRPTRFAVVALDEGAADEERTPGVLLDRLGLLISLEELSIRDVEDADALDAAIVSARRTVARVIAPETAAAALCATALALGVYSLRPPMAALAAARALAALDGRPMVDEGDLSLAAALVIAPRATRMPEPMTDETDETQPPPHEEAESMPDSEPGESEPQSVDDAEMQSVVLAAALAALPPGLLERLADHARRRGAPPSSGRQGPTRKTRTRGRPAGTRPGRLGAGDRLDLVATLRAAAPWQRLRRSVDAANPSAGPKARVRVHPDDFRIRRMTHPVSSTTVFVVDASGSSALHRLAEVKGAVELMLAECYVRRDSVALIAFRGKKAELILPETRSLARAKRCLAGLAGGGRTPLASALVAALDIGMAVERKGNTASVIVLTDGISNVALDGTGGRATAGSDVESVARAFRASGLKALLIDTSPRGQPQAERLAPAMGAAYLMMPYAGARELSRLALSEARPAG
ncbi:MAG: magnesium chelatase subunit D [Hyphomicrobium sp.]|nr:magnesium chelatase subunit D [Hyphomicrobium sp.]